MNPSAEWPTHRAANGESGSSSQQFGFYRDPSEECRSNSCFVYPQRKKWRTQSHEMRFTMAKIDTVENENEQIQRESFSGFRPSKAE
jgi:hypothetical protein